VETVLRQAATARQEVEAALALLVETVETVLVVMAALGLHQVLLVLPCNEQVAAVFLQTLQVERHQVVAARVTPGQLLALQTLEAVETALAQAVLGL
jgi:hypothetical protein